ncbi:hemerythrin domain-containing protein [Streptomyces palmae]|uniref:Hemerythrin domain-containing protein n=1 Tax=Streptomyces palmae TaxID=1701085 RepID=A0A4Z0HFN7_9ACTN|nr:hemerythrin domain-containing protein [Streptomyces palmae]TGB19142.1 hemerythrin domain-containing protein [Streptomyces palmae]
MSANATPRPHLQTRLTMITALHDALRRDVALLMSAVWDLTERAADGNGTPTGGETDDLSGIRAGWETFRRYLTMHQLAEDIVLWPAVRANPRIDSRHTRSLDAMEDDHNRLHPLTEQVDRALAAADGRELRRSTEDFCVFLLAHLDREEAEVLPLAMSAVSAREWALFEREQRRQLGADWAAEFYPWLLDGASDTTHREALRLLPVARRLAFHTRWRPRYEQRHRWRPAVTA